MKTDTTQRNIPNGWQERKLGDVCDIINGSTPKRSISEYWENGNIPWFTVDDIRSSGRIISKTNQSITDKALKETSVKLLPEDSVLLCCTASLGEVALTKIPLTTNQQFNGLVSKDKKSLFPYYLFYSAQKLGENLKSKSGKTTINFLSVGSLAKEKVLLPPIKEQQKIAEILGTVDEDIARTQEVIRATEKLKRGLMQQLFTRGIGHVKFKDTELGEIPAEWEAVKLGDIGINYIGLTYSPKNVTDNTGTLVLRSSNVQDGYISYGDNVYVDSDIPEHLITKKGDILLCTRNGSRNLIGKCAFIDANSAGHSFGAFMSVYRTKYSDFIFQVFLSDIFKNQINKFLGATINQITNSSLNSFIVPLPPVEEQNEIVKILSSVDERISVNKKLKAKLNLLKKGLMQDLLSGKVRVTI